MADSKVMNSKSSSNQLPAPAPVTHLDLGGQLVQIREEIDQAADHLGQFRDLDYSIIVLDGHIVSAFEALMRATSALTTIVEHLANKLADES